MMLLAIDTTSSIASVALLNLNTDQVVDSLSSDDTLSHLQNLMPMIDRILVKNEIDLKEIDCIAVSEGPGSFTGIRIGISTAKALCQALSIPIISVPTLEAFAYKYKLHKGIVCPILDARRNQVYSEAFHNGKTILPLGAYELNTLVEKLQAYLNEIESRGRILFTGDGVLPYKEYLRERIRSVFLYELQDAGSVAEIGSKMYKAGASKHYLEITPVYVRRAEAERKLLGKTMHIRPMEEKDLDQISAIDELCFSMPWSKNTFLQELQTNKLATYLVAESKEGKIVGYAGIWNIIEEGHITNIAVHPEFRRSGIGRMLIKAILDKSEEFGIKQQTLEVRPSNLAAIKLYGQFGFKEEGRRKNYYEDNGEDALILWRRDT